jgi:AMMECR1 domain-containing protein
MLSEEDKKVLRDIAHQSIEQGLSSGHALRVDLSQYNPALCENRATFVTLNIHDQLRGCIGILEPLRPLEPLRRDELSSLSIHISILNTPEEMQFDSEQDLIDQLRPGKDGIILQERGHKATFLPSVWQSVKDKNEFLEHLKQQTGLPRDYWSNTIRIQRYSVDDV